MHTDTSDTMATTDTMDTRDSATTAGRHGRKRRYVASGLLLGLTAGAGAGFVLQQGGFAGAAAPAAAAVDPVDDTSDGADTVPAEVRPEPGVWVQEALQPLIDAGTITQEQADAVIEALADARPVPGRPLRVATQTIADALGVTVDELRTALQDGSTIREIATSEGVDPHAVVDALVAEASARLDEQVTDGELTREEADARLVLITSGAEELLDETPPFFERGPRGHWRRAHPDARPAGEGVGL